MKKSILIILALLCFAIFFPARLVGEVVDTDPHMTGLIMPTPEEIAMMKQTYPRVVGVKLNKLGLDRINTYRKTKNLLNLPADASVSLGDELVTVIGVQVPPALGFSPQSLKKLSRAMSTTASCRVFPLFVRKDP